MKKKLLMFGSYVLVAMLATVITLAMVGMNPPSKLDRLEALIENRFIGEADTQAMEDAAAAARALRALCLPRTPLRQQW